MKKEEEEEEWNTRKVHSTGDLQRLHLRNKQQQQQPITTPLGSSYPYETEFPPQQFYLSTYSFFLLPRYSAPVHGDTFERVQSRITFARHARRSSSLKENIKYSTQQWAALQLSAMRSHLLLRIEAAAKRGALKEWEWKKRVALRRRRRSLSLGRRTAATTDVDNNDEEKAAEAEREANRKRFWASLDMYAPNVCPSDSEEEEREEEQEEQEQEKLEKRNEGSTTITRTIATACSSMTVDEYSVVTLEELNQRQQQQKATNEKEDQEEEEPETEEEDTSTGQPALSSTSLLRGLSQNEEQWEALSWQDKFLRVFDLLRRRAQPDTQMDETQQQGIEDGDEEQEDGWNETVEDRYRVYHLLGTLSRDFIIAAKEYGKIIITERFLPVSQKTIKPTNHKGLGGDKFLVNNIYFKFAIDRKGLFGGERAGDECAAKVAAHELKSLIHVMNVWVPAVYFPMMVLVEYRGFTLIAMTALPIAGTNTLKYGSNDAGRTVRNDAPALDRKMKLLAERLNLKPHLVRGGTNGQKPVVVYTAADFEGHVGLDGRHYVLDFSRTFPPTPYQSSRPGSHLYNLFRPEFVRKYPNGPLCSDAYSSFMHESEFQEHNADIPKAFAYLEEHNIPAFAHYLLFEVAEMEKTMDFPLIQKLHFYGINVRYLGRVRSALQQLRKQSKEAREACITSNESEDKEGEEQEQDILKQLMEEQEAQLNKSIYVAMRNNNSSSSPFSPSSLSTPCSSSSCSSSSASATSLDDTFWEDLILLEMIARVCKSIIKRKLRKKMQRTTSQEAFNKIVIDHINMMLGNCHSSSRNERFWQRKLKPGLMTKFENALTPEESRPDFSLYDMFARSDTLQHQQQQTTSVTNDPIHQQKNFLFQLDWKTRPSTKPKASKRAISNFFNSLGFLFYRTSKMLGAKFDDCSLKTILKDPFVFLRSCSPLDHTDLDHLKVRVKYMNIAAHAQAVTLLMKAHEGIGLEGPGAATTSIPQPPAIKSSNGRIAGAKYVRLNTKAIELLYKALDCDPSNHITLRKLGDALAAMDRDAEARIAYKAAIKANPSDCANYFRYAVLLEKVHKYDMAEYYYLQGLERQPTNATCLSTYADFVATFRRNNRDANRLYAAALYRCEEELQSEREGERSNKEAQPQFQPPTYPHYKACILNNYAIFRLFAFGDTVTAEKMFRHCVTTEPNNARFLRNSANFLLRKHEFTAKEERMVCKQQRNEKGKENGEKGEANAKQYGDEEEEQEEKKRKRSEKADMETNRDLVEANKYLDRALELERIYGTKGEDWKRLQRPLVFITANRFKFFEASKILNRSHKKWEIRMAKIRLASPLKDPQRNMLSPVLTEDQLQRFKQRLEAAYSILCTPLIFEKVGLQFCDEERTFGGKAIRDVQSFAKANNGRRLCLFLYVAFTDGCPEHDRVFEGRIYCKVVYPPRGTEGFGFDTIMEPEGIVPPRTISELHRNRHLISMRTNPYTQLNLWLDELQRTKPQQQQSFHVVHSL
ncbi:Clu domain-containing protein [Balamuthia mandrillaris]